MDFLHQLEWSSLMDSVVFFTPRMVVALICGFIIGLEREVKGKDAGLRTCILICIGSTLFSSIAVLVHHQSGGDPTRIAAQVVSGIGFLGGGVILHTKGSVYGITTAAAIWLVAAIGVAIGVELYPAAIATSVICVGVLIAVRDFEKKFTEQLQQKNRLCLLEFSTNQAAGELDEIYLLLQDLKISPAEMKIEKDNKANHYTLKTSQVAPLIKALNQKTWVTKITHKTNL